MSTKEFEQGFHSNMDEKCPYNADNEERQREDWLKGQNAGFMFRITHNSNLSPQLAD